MRIIHRTDFFNSRFPVFIYNSHVNSDFLRAILVNSAQPLYFLPRANFGSFFFANPPGRLLPITVATILVRDIIPFAMTALIDFKLAFLPLSPLKSMTNFKEKAQLYHFHAQLTSVTNFCMPD